jgi:PadR family transcriptional regulator, regulatory protein PadR
VNLDLLLLAALKDGPAHGYRISELLRERSGGVLEFPEGTIYPALHRLERSGLLSSSWVTAEGRKRRVYRLTRRGRTALAAQRREWSDFRRAVEAVIA